jgi:twitching motility two-component system response regulator PilG
VLPADSLGTFLIRHNIRERTGFFFRELFKKLFNPQNKATRVRFLVAFSIVQELCDFHVTTHSVLYVKVYQYCELIRRLSKTIGSDLSVEVPVIKKKILVVEDEESLLKLQSILLTLRGYNVEGVTDGQAALEAVVTMKPDLILLDIMLPKIDGLEVCRQLKTNVATRHIPIIMLTAKKSKEDLVMGEQAGADMYITKPYKSSMVIETIQRILS